MDIQEIDPQIRSVLLIALAECIISRPDEQVTFIANYIEKHSVWDLPYEPCLNYAHESSEKCNRETLEDLCLALEGPCECMPEYIRVIFNAIQMLAPVSISTNSSRNEDGGVFYRIRSGNSQFDLRICDPNVPEEIHQMIKLIVHNLNSL
jgi:hypothetical protein